MTTEALLGIDLGQTRTKVLVVDLSGRQLAVAFDASEPCRPDDLWAERDLEDMWDGIATTIRSAVGRAGEDVVVLGVGVSGHSDGVYLVDDARSPVRRAILATDARARRDAAQLSTSPAGAGALGWRSTASDHTTRPARPTSRPP